MIKQDEDYLMVYLIGGGICLMKFIALICFKENEPYHFKNKNGEIINSEKNDNENENEKENEENNNDLGIEI